MNNVFPFLLTAHEGRKKKLRKNSDTTKENEFFEPSIVIL